MDLEQENLMDSFSETLFNENLQDVGIDILDISLSGIFEMELLDEIPVVKTLSAIVKTGYQFRSRNLIRQTLVFIKELNDGIANEEEKERVATKIQAGGKEAQEEIERILLILESNLEIEKSQILARFTLAYVRELIDVSEYYESTDILTRLYLSDIPLLLDVYNKVVEDSVGEELYRIDRLNGMGLITKSLKRIGSGREDSDIKITTIGRVFCRFGLLIKKC